MANDFITQQSLDDFHKAKNRARMHSLFDKLTWKNPDLMSLYEVTSIIKPKKETYLGMKTIEIDRIIGSEGRYRDFSAAFLPKREMLRARWTSVDQARLSDVVLPPISVFELGGYYFVRDGNHRVSVARSMGVEYIDAEVVELDSEIPLEPGMTTRQLKQRVVQYERNAFIEQYKPSYLPMGEISFTTPGSYPEMVNHILVHKYYINQNVKGEISFEDAARSWYANVYEPIVRQIREDNLMFYFPGNAEGDLYMWLVRRWDEMKKTKADTSIKEAADKLKKESSASVLRRWIDLVRDRFRRR